MAMYRCVPLFAAFLGCRFVVTLGAHQSLRPLLSSFFLNPNDADGNAASTDPASGGPFLSQLPALTLWLRPVGSRRRRRALWRPPGLKKKTTTASRTSGPGFVHPKGQHRRGWAGPAPPPTPSSSGSWTWREAPRASSIEYLPALACPGLAGAARPCHPRETGAHQ